MVAKTSFELKLKPTRNNTNVDQSDKGDLDENNGCNGVVKMIMEITMPFLRMPMPMTMMPMMIMMPLTMMIMTM